MTVISAVAEAVAGIVEVAVIVLEQVNIELKIFPVGKTHVVGGITVVRKYDEQAGVPEWVGNSEARTAGSRQFSRDSVNGRCPAHLADSYRHCRQTMLYWWCLLQPRPESRGRQQGRGVLSGTFSHRNEPDRNDRLKPGTWQGSRSVI